ncbi:barstar family protein [Gottfriedia acidiceleris]|uniref:barstar family protein n=1 Tax=Gottfriedia acidiceleris TaxID=371036 RepID=UPI003B585EB9
MKKDRKKYCTLLPPLLFILIIIMVYLPNPKTLMFYYAVPVTFVYKVQSSILLFFLFFLPYFVVYLYIIEKKKTEAPTLIIDVTKVRTNKELHSLLKEKLKFPDYYSENWDAFWEAITGVVELPNKIEFVGWSELVKRLPEDSNIMKECLLEHNQEFPNWKCEFLFN